MHLICKSGPQHWVNIKINWRDLNINYVQVLLYKKILISLRYSPGIQFSKINLMCCRQYICDLPPTKLIC